MIPALVKDHMGAMVRVAKPGGRVAAMGRGEEYPAYYRLSQPDDDHAAGLEPEGPHKLTGTSANSHFRNGIPCPLFSTPSTERFYA
jgi:hypothetical protein